MQKTKKSINIAVVAIMVLSMLSMYAYVPAQAASLNDAKDTISNSDISAPNVTHVITFTTGIALADTDYAEVVLPGAFTNVVEANLDCHGLGVASVVGNTLLCTAGGAVAATSTMISITGVTNPGAGSYTITLATKHAGGAEIEKAQIKVYIIDNVTVTASVDASLTFSVSGLNVGDSVNGAAITATSSATTTPFGTLAPNVTSTVGQRINVGTNANDGYIVTVQQNQELRTAAGAIINSFNNAAVGSGLVPGSATAFVPPSNQLANPDTWGHMGITTGDDIAEFAGGKFAGLAGTAPMTIMSHNGPSDSVTDNIGSSTVAYSARITALQEAGDYSNELTYVCTPQF